jgi:hypothetical protein
MFSGSGSVAKLQIRIMHFLLRLLQHSVYDDLNWDTNQFDVSLLENIVNNALVLLREDGTGGIDQVATGFGLRILHRKKQMYNCFRVMKNYKIPQLGRVQYNSVSDENRPYCKYGSSLFMFKQSFGSALTKCGSGFF